MTKRFAHAMMSPFAHCVLRVIVPILACCVSVISAEPGNVADSGGMPNDLSLGELMDMEIGVATGGKTSSLNEAPGIVSVITRDEIQRLAARTLMDVLLTVPGFSFGADTWGLVGIAVRGNWANEGKTLLLIDDIEMNERSYGNIQFLKHYPLHAVERIEIIRGPGSAVYGGSAELAVIKIITRSATSINGVTVNGVYGANAKGTDAVGGAIGLGGTIREAHLSVDAHAAHAQRSTHDYTDVYGSSYPLDGNADVTALCINTGLDYRNFQARMIIDRYGQQERDGYDAVYDSPARMRFDTYALRLAYSHVMPAMTLKPTASLAYQLPWWEEYTPAAGPNQQPWTKSVFTGRAGLLLDWDINPQINVIAGCEGILDHSHSFIDNTYPDSSIYYFHNNTLDLSQTAFSLFLQGIFNSEFVNMTIGGRNQYSPEYGWALVPRGALTKDFGVFHVKLLGSGSYRSPGLENINSTQTARAAGYPLPAITAEKTWVAEAEAGAHINENITATANVFHIRINDPLVYFSDDTYSDEIFIDGYRNFSRTGSQGLELDCRFRYPFALAALSYSFQRAYKNEVISFNVPGSSASLLAMPTHTVAAHISFFAFEKKLAITPSVTGMSRRYATTSVDDNGYLVYEHLPVSALCNLHIRYVLPNNISLTISGHDLLNDGLILAQPYDGYHAPMATSTRSVSFVVQGDFTFPY